MTAEAGRAHGGSVERQLEDEVQSAGSIPLGVRLPEPSQQLSSAELLVAVERVRMQVATLSLALEVDGVSQARGERDGVLSQLDDYLLPRLRRRDAPLLAVIGGSTGAGKSTLTNSLVRREVSRSGVLRPTTRSPVLVHHPYDSGAFLSQRILPRLTRVTSEAPEPLQPIDANAPRITGLRLVPHEGLTPGMAIIDAPDIDSLVETNRDLAVQLLQAADLWIFVTTAARYGDALPWQMLKQAADRGATVAVVLDRVPPAAISEIRIHLATRLRDGGLAGTPLFVIPETQTVDGFLPAPLVEPLQQWLGRVAGDPRSRSVIVERTLKGAVASLPERVDLLAAAADRQAQGWAALRVEVNEVYTAYHAWLAGGGMTDGSLIRGELLARWQEFIANGDFARRIDGAARTLADRVTATVRREGEIVVPMDVPVTAGIVDAIRGAVRDASEAILAGWRQYPFGSALLAARGDQVGGPDLETRLHRTTRDWRLWVSSLITAAVEAAGQAEPEARVDLATVGDVLFVAVMNNRSPTDGPESPTAATVDGARRIVERFLGVEATESLIQTARTDLASRAVEVLSAECRRFERLLENAENVDERGRALRSTIEFVEAAG